MCLAVVMRLRRNLFVKTPIESKMKTFTKNLKFVPLKACETPDDLVVPHCNHTTKIEPVYDECGCLKAYRCCPSSCPTPVNNCKTGQVNIDMKNHYRLILFHPAKMSSLKLMKSCLFLEYFAKSELIKWDV